MNPHVPMADVVQEEPPCIRMMNSILNYSADFLEGKLRYEVQWKGDNQTTWETEDAFDGQSGILEAYWKTVGGKPPRISLKSAAKKPKRESTSTESRGSAKKQRKRRRRRGKAEKENTASNHDELSSQDLVEKTIGAISKKSLTLIDVDRLLDTLRTFRHELSSQDLMKQEISAIPKCSLMPLDVDLLLNALKDFNHELSSHDLVQQTISAISKDSLTPIDVDRLLNALRNLKPAKRIPVSDLGLSNIVKIFGLNYDSEWIELHPITNKSVGKRQVPPQLSEMLAGYRKGPWLRENEAFCRMSVDAMLWQCSEQLVREKVMPENATLRHEQSISVDLQGLRICGRADYALGHDGDLNRKDCGALLAAMEAKSEASFSSAKPQLLGYLAMMRYQRLVVEKVNCYVQGFYTDGTHYHFVRISPEGQVQESLQFNTLSQTGLGKIFNFVCDQLATSMLSTPTITKRLPFPHSSTQIEKYESETWRVAFAIDELCEEYGV